MEENVGAADVELSAAELGSIQQALAHIDVQGARYPESQLATIDE